MSEIIVIGKHTLESLTSGMYSDPFVVYREYIQNSVDSIDRAYEEGILSTNEGTIHIIVSAIDRTVEIIDNGTGLPFEEVERTLISIGNSKKKQESTRGFRGIGRLAALSYCKRLVFSTSYFGEDRGTSITIDAEKLATLLMEDASDITVTDVLQQIYELRTHKETQDSHFFKVLLEGVDPASDLCDFDSIVSYLEQNIPVPYDPEQFDLGREIYGRILRDGYMIKDYRVFVSNGTKHIQVFKPYRNTFLVDKGKNITDTIQDIDIVKVPRADGALSAIGWIAKTNYLGSIHDKTVKGLRLRKGNILVGDAQTLNVIFKDARFNGWSIGEIFAIDQNLVPNARRDNFEKNASYFYLFEHLAEIAVHITKDIRTASLNRNSSLSRAIEKEEQLVHVAEGEIDDGIAGSRKGVLRQKLIKAQEELSNALAGDSTASFYKQIAFDELDMLMGKLSGATSYKALNSLSNLTNTEKRILERVFNVIVSHSQSAEELIEAILEEFESH